MVWSAKVRVLPTLFFLTKINFKINENKRYINCEIGLKVVMNEFENGKKARIKEKRN